LPGKYGRLHDLLTRCTYSEPAADLRVLAFSILPNDPNIDGLLMAQRRTDAVKQPNRAKAYVLFELLSDWYQ
jgi:hypothetical protein